MLKSIWTYVVIAVVLAGLAILMFGPSQSQVGHDMTTPDTSAIVQGEAIANVVIPATFSENAQIGKNVFDGACAACHGENAAGKNGVAPPLVHNIYEPSHHGDQAFWSAAQNGVQSHHWNFGNMLPVEDLTRSDVGYIVAYVRELQRENGIN